MSTGTAGEARLADAAATESLGKRLAGQLRPGMVVLLEGPLGAGKTTLVRGVVGGLDGHPSEVCSPTFTLLETYDVAGNGIRRLHHADLYRVRGRLRAPWEEIGLSDAFEDPEGVTAIEWPEAWQWLSEAAERVLRVRLSFSGNGRTVVWKWIASGT